MDFKKTSLILIILILFSLNIYAWTDNSITNSTLIKRSQVNELRTVIDLVRVDVGLSAYSWTDATLTNSTYIKASHFNETRKAINQIYTQIGLGTPSWSGTIIPGGIPRINDIVGSRDNLTYINNTIDTWPCCGRQNGTDTGSAGQCPGTDDSACGVISCSNYFYNWSGATCYNRADFTTNRCAGINSCKPPNPPSCSSQGQGGAYLTCGNTSCVNAATCNGTTAGACYTDGAQHACPVNNVCDGTGTCKKIDGQSCSSSSECYNNNCRKEINSASYYCAAAGKECSISGGAGYDTAGISQPWICTGQDTSSQCTAICSTVLGNTYYCNGAGSWLSGDGTSLVCRASAGVCDVADYCDGAGSCTSDSKLSGKQAGCNSACQACDGSNDACQNVGNGLDTYNDCTFTSNSLDCHGDVCNGAGACQYNSGGTCRNSAGTCDSAETCTGSSFGCPVDSKVAAGEGGCAACSRCDGSNNACQTMTSNVEDNEGSNLCTGTCAACQSGSCSYVTGVNQDPDNDCTFTANTLDCTSDYCSGASASCGYNSGGTCRNSAGTCDSAETCTGGSSSCPSDSKLPLGQQGCADCKYCDGSNNACQNVGNGLDTYNDCTDSGWNGCSATCTKTKSSTDFCNGAGSCQTDSTFVSGNNVCSGGSEITPTLGTNCGTNDVCSDGDCSGTTYYRACSAGTGACRGSGDYTGAGSAAIYPGYGQTFTNICTNGGSTCGYGGYEYCSGQTIGRDYYGCSGGLCIVVAGQTYDGGSCTGDCNDACVNGACVNTAAGSPRPDSIVGTHSCTASHSYACSGQAIEDYYLCSALTDCEYAVDVCFNNCNSVCVNGQSTCQNTFQGTDPYNLCNGGLSCIGINILDSNVCSSDVGCGWVTSSCSGATPVCFNGACVECNNDYDCSSCQKCSNHACVSQASNEDIKGDCADVQCQNGLCDGGGGCDYYTSQDPNGQCTASGWTCSGGEGGGTPTQDNNGLCKGSSAVACETTSGSACGNTCSNYCVNGASSCTDAPVFSVADCPWLNCASEGYYWGWSGNTCYYRASVQDTCNGAGRCWYASEGCPAQGQGNVTTWVDFPPLSWDCTILDGCYGTTGPIISYRSIYEQSGSCVGCSACGGDGVCYDVTGVPPYCDTLNCMYYGCANVCC